MSFDASSSFLAVVGEGGQGNGYAVISLWSCFISKGSNDVMIRSHLRFPRPVSSNVLPIHQDQQWSISFSPTSGSERLTVSAASPCSPGLLIAHASEGKLVNARRTTSRSMASSPRKGIREEGVDNETCCDWWSASSLIVGRNDGQVSIVDVATDQVLFSSIFSSGLRVWRMNHSTSSGGHLVPCALILEPCLDGWKLSAMIERTPEEMMVILANKGEWEETLQIAETYNLDRDEVYRLKWKSQRVDAASIASCLSLIVDKGWVVEECATCVAEDPQVQSILISHGLDLTESYCLGTEGLQIHDAHIGWWRRMRLLLLRHKDRLDTYLIMQSKSPGWDVEAFASFRDSDMISVAKELAGCGDVSRLSALIQRHSRILGPFLLDILDQVPESLDPRLYAQLLPKVSR